MRIPVPAEACTSGESLPAVHGCPDHEEIGANGGCNAPMTKALLLMTALLLPPGPVVQGFEPPATVYGAGHRGIDIASRPGGRVRSPIGGRVTFAGRIHDRSTISVTSGRRIVSIEPVSASVEVGQQVSAGDVIGVVDVGGHCSLRCVHIGVRVDGVYVDPSLARRRLLPLGRRSDVPHAPER